MNADLKDINGETFKTSRVTDNMSPRYPISAPMEKLGLRADDALPNGATKSADGKKVSAVAYSAVLPTGMKPCVRVRDAMYRSR